MAYDLYAPFVEATRSVFQLMLDLGDIADRPAESFVRGDALSVAIGVTGDLTGEVIYLFPSVTSLHMVSIMSGMEVDSVDDFVTSAVAEIANIISGNVVTLLSGDNFACDILPPELREPDDSAAYELRAATCLSTSLGDMCLDIRLNSMK
jgi:chemotaxis protein CheX